MGCLTRIKSNSILRLIFTKSLHFGPSTARDHYGHTPLLMALMPYGPIGDADEGFDSQQNIEKLDLLLKKGCSVNDTNFIRSTCLHMFFGGVVPSLTERNWRDSLIYLIRQGADPRALDAEGRSVSHIAYSKTCRNIYNDNNGRATGSYEGDLFDVVIQSCGYDIYEFRKEYPRRAKYGTRYSRQDFESLWEDIESPCPYWDDMDWPSSLNSDGINEDDHQAFICICDYEPCLRTWMDAKCDDERKNDGDNDDSEGADSEHEYSHGLRWI